MAWCIVRTKVSSWPGRHSRIFSSISGTSATSTRAVVAMPRKSKARTSLRDRFEPRGAEAIAPVAARRRVRGMGGEDGGGTPVFHLGFEKIQHRPRVLRIEVPGRL